jgi:hypothetical protein
MEPLTLPALGADIRERSGVERVRDHSSGT